MLSCSLPTATRPPENPLPAQAPSITPAARMAALWQPPACGHEVQSTFECACCFLITILQGNLSQMVAEPQRLLGRMPHITGLKIPEPDGLFLSPKVLFGKGDTKINERPAQSCESES